MSKTVYVGSLPWEITDDELRELFSQAGSVESVNIITDKFSGKSKGFAFVEMSSEQDAQAAIKKFDQYQLGQRTIVVNEARPKSEQRPYDNRYGNQQRGFRPRDRY